MNWCGSMKTDTVGRMVVTDKTDFNKRRVSLQHVEVLAGEGVISKVERWLGGRLKDIRAFIEGLYEPDLHAKRVDALAGATGRQRSPSSWWPGMSDARSVGTICQRDGWDIPRLCGNPKKSLANQFCRDSDPFHDPPRLPRP